MGKFGIEKIDKFCKLCNTIYGKTFAVVHKTHHSLENFRGASGPCHYVLYTANDSRGKLSRLAKKQRKPRKISPSKVLPYTVFYLPSIRIPKLFQSATECISFINTHHEVKIQCSSMFFIYVCVIVSACAFEHICISSGI